MQSARDEGFRLAMVARDLERDTIQIQQWFSDISATRGQDGLNDGLDEADKAYASLRDGLVQVREYFQRVGDEAGLATVAQLSTRAEAYHAMGRRMAQAYMEQGPAGGNPLMPEFDATAVALNDMLQPFLASMIQSAHDNLGAVAQRAHALQFGLVFSTVAALLLSLLVGWLAARSITIPIARIGAGLRRMSDGDLTRPLDWPPHRDQISAVASDVNRLGQSLVETIRAINMQSGSIGGFVEELVKLRGSLSKDADDMIAISHDVASQNGKLNEELETIHDSVTQSSRNTEQFAHSAQAVAEAVNTIAAASEQANQNVSTMAAAAEQMTANVSEVHGSLGQVNRSVGLVSTSVGELSDAARQVRIQCGNAATESRRANDQAHEAAQVMDRLQDATHEIGKVVELINAIAEQTNMLALNASIEAAGAGDTGKGFAVVANEVKALARQTAEATAGIADQMENIRRNGEESSRSAKRIAELIRRIDDANQDITIAVEGQSISLGAINRAISEVDEATTVVTRSAAELNEAAGEVARAAAEAAQGTAEIARSSSQAAHASSEMDRLGADTLALTRNALGAVEVTREASRQVKERNDDLGRVITYLRGQINHFRSLGEVAASITQEMFQAQSALDIGPEPFAIRRMKQVHLVLLGTLERAVKGAVQLGEEDIRNHEACDLGKWLFGPGKEIFQGKPLYEKLVQVHRMIHETALDVVREVNARQVSAAEASMVYFRHLRDTLFELLNQLYLGQEHDLSGAQAVLVWEKSGLALGIPEVDADHRRLVDLVNAIAAKECESTQDYDRKALQQLQNFVHTHFPREERMLESLGYPRLQEHKEIHAGFVLQLEKIARRMETERQPICAEISRFLQSWLTEHILKVDADYVPLVQKADMR
ncbi:MAG: bacteriohemerythrin [Magnetococcus sp. WYHC-3]